MRGKPRGTSCTRLVLRKHRERTTGRAPGRSPATQSNGTSQVPTGAPPAPPKLSASAIWSRFPHFADRIRRHLRGGAVDVLDGTVNGDGVLDDDHWLAKPSRRDDRHSFCEAVVPVPDLPVLTGGQVFAELQFRAARYDNPAAHNEPSVCQGARSAGSAGARRGGPATGGRTLCRVAGGSGCD